MHPKLGLGEPDAGPWRVESLTDFAAELARLVPRFENRARVVAIDGRSGSGKTTLARRLISAIPRAALVETDDLSWYSSRFGWGDQLRDGVLTPVRSGFGVHYRLPDSAEHGTMGHVDVPEGAEWVFVEGVGSSRRSLGEVIDASVWVQSDAVEADRRGIVRNGGDTRAAVRWAEWMSEEGPFLEADRPWERAILIVAGPPDVRYDRELDVVVAPGM